MPLASIERLSSWLLKKLSPEKIISKFLKPLNFCLEQFLELGQVSFHERFDLRVLGGVIRMESWYQFVAAKIERPAVDIV